MERGVPWAQGCAGTACSGGADLPVCARPASPAALAAALAEKVEKLAVSEAPAAAAPAAPVVDEPVPQVDESAILKAYEQLMAEDPRCAAAQGAREGAGGHGGPSYGLAWPVQGACRMCHTRAQCNTHLCGRACAEQRSTCAADAVGLSISSALQHRSSSEEQACAEPGVALGSLHGSAGLALSCKMVQALVSSCRRCLTGLLCGY